MITVTHVLTDSNIGGAGVLLCNLLAHIDRKKIFSRVLLPKNARLSPRIKELGVPLVEADIKPDCSFAVGDFFKYCDILDRYPTEILHTHGALCARLAGKYKKTPAVLLTRHCDTALKIPSFVYNKTTDCTIATSRALYDRMVGYGVERGRLCFIPNGAAEQKEISEKRKEELRRRLSISEGDFVLGTVGRLEEIKGQSVFLDAAAELLKKRENCVFLIVGRGSKRQELEAQSRALGISEKVRFCGHSDKVGELLNLFTVFINASLGSETSSLAISEAMSLGIPVVASDIEGNGYMLNYGSCGLLFENKNPRELSNQLFKLLDDKEKRRLIGEAGKNRYKNEFTPKTMARRYEEVYLSLAREREGRF